MSTRSIVAAHTTAPAWHGVYTHWDGYPTSHGPIIWKLMAERDWDFRRFAQEIIADHPSGWSVLGENCYCHPERSTDEHWKDRPAEQVNSTYDSGENGEMPGDAYDLPGPYVYVLGENALTIYDAGGQSLAKLDYRSAPDWEAIP